MSRAVPLASLFLGLSAGYILGGCHHPPKPEKPCPEAFVFDKATVESPFEGLDPSFLRHNYEFTVHRVVAPGCAAKWLADGEPEPYRAWLVTFEDASGRKLTYSLKQVKPTPTEPKTDRPVTDWRP